MSDDRREPPGHDEFDEWLKGDVLPNEVQDEVEYHWKRIQSWLGNPEAHEWLKSESRCPYCGTEPSPPGPADPLVPVLEKQIKEKVGVFRDPPEPAEPEDVMPGTITGLETEIQRLREELEEKQHWLMNAEDAARATDLLLQGRTKERNRLRGFAQEMLKIATRWIEDAGRMKPHNEVFGSWLFASANDIKRSATEALEGGG